MLFRDDSNQSAFYAVSSKPRLARAADGTPEFSLMLYGKRHSGVFEPTGGVLSFTVSLGLSAQEERAVITALTERFSASGPGAPPPKLQGIQWSSGETRLSGKSGISATSKPSLLGENRTSFSLRLNADQAKAAKAGDLSIEVCYETQVGLAAVPMTFSGLLNLAEPGLAGKTTQVEM